MGIMPIIEKKTRTITALLSETCLRLKKADKLFIANIVISLSILAYIDVTMLKIIKCLNLVREEMLSFKDNKRI